MVKVEEYKTSDNNVPWNELSNIVRNAFKERTEQGLLFSCRDFSAAELKESSGDGFVFVGKDESENLLGLMILTVFSDNTGYLQFVATEPSLKHSGVASTLFKAFIQKCKDLKLDHLGSSTADGATSSVRWHLKMGFKKYSYYSSPKTNYYSYIFRYQLKEKKYYTIKRLFNFLFNKIFTKITKTPEGTWRFPFIVKIFRNLHLKK